MRRLLVGILLLIISFSVIPSAHAQATVEVTNAQVVYHFGEQVNFQATVKASAPIQNVVILFRAQGESSTRSGAATLTEDGQVSYQYTFENGPLPSFAPVDYWFRVTLQTGEKVESSPFHFTYDDNRFPWKTVEDGSVRLHWYTGDDAFAQQARDIARVGLKKTGQMLSVSPGQLLDVYVYALPADLQSALQIGGQSFAVGGEASPDLGVALVAISPGLEQGPEMERKLPHELAHLLTHELVGERYARLPVWLREGIASMAEPANPNYAELLSVAREQNVLIPIAELCGAFPPETSRVLLAYAESEAFTRYIVNKYGDTGLVSLAQAYADDLDCQQGAVRALGSPLNQVEAQWLGNAPAAPDVVNTDTPQSVDSSDWTPYLALLLMMLIAPVGFIAVVWRMPLGRRRPGSK